MANPLLNLVMQATACNNPQIGKLQEIMNMLKGQNPDEVVEKFARVNPQFAAFLKENKGKSTEELSQKYGINLTEIMSMLK